MCCLLSVAVWLRDARVVASSKRLNLVKTAVLDSKIEVFAFWYRFEVIASKMDLEADWAS